MSSYKSLVLTPATDEELKLYIDSLYELYKPTDIEIMKKYNIHMIDDSICFTESLFRLELTNETKKININNNVVEEKAYFINLNNLEIELENIINERPIYMIETKEKTVEEYTIINGLDIPLENILNKNYKKLKKC